MSEQTTKPVNKNNSEWSQRERGAIWENESKLSIQIKNNDGKIIKFIAFRNKYRDPNDLDSKLPHWRIYTDIKDYQSSNSTTTKPAPKVKKETVTEPVAAQTETAPDF